MKDSVLVTGGAGYIGSVVVAQLLARGYPVVVLDDLSRGHRAAVAPEATFVQGGVGDRAALDALLRSHRCHALVHLAAYALVGESVAEPEMYRANNVRSEEHTSELQSLAYLVCRLLLEKKKSDYIPPTTETS